MPAHFKLRRNPLTRQYRWALVASNGETVAVSETYKRKRSAADSIAAVKTLASKAEVVDET